jgi:hypothetical protein
VRAVTAIFQDGYAVKGSTIDEARDACLEAIKNRLPEEACREDVLTYILDEAKEKLKTYRVAL